MLVDHPMTLTIPVSDLERARAWYRDKLGFNPVHEVPGEALAYRTGSGPAELAGFGLLLQPLQRQLDVFGVGRGAVLHPGRELRRFTDPTGTAVPGALGHLAAALGRFDVVAPAGHGHDAGRLDVEGEGLAWLRIGDGAYGGPPA